MSSLPDHVARARHHRTQRPTSHWSPDLTDTTPHPGVPSACPTCLKCRTCHGSGEVSPNPEAYSTPALILTECPDCGGSGERSASRVHADSYCVTHCRPGIKHSQCGCSCDHREVTA